MGNRIDNLKGSKGKPFTPENARDFVEKSVAARREKRRYRDLLREALEASAEGGGTKAEKSARELADKMAAGSLAAIELGLKIEGELADKHEITGADGSDLFAKLSDEDLEKRIEQLSKICEKQK